MNKATLRPLTITARRPKLTAQQRKEAAARRAALPSKGYLRGVEGCTYKPLRVATVNNISTTNTQEVASNTLGWRDDYNTSK